MDDDSDIDPGIESCLQLALSTPVLNTSPAVVESTLNVRAFGMNLPFGSPVRDATERRMGAGPKTSSPTACNV